MDQEEEEEEEEEDGEEEVSNIFNSPWRNYCIIIRSARRSFLIPYNMQQ
jgi:hypothetical protein